MEQRQEKIRRQEDYNRGGKSIVSGQSRDQRLDYSQTYSLSEVTSISKDEKLHNHDFNNLQIFSLSPLGNDHLLLSCSILSLGNTFYTKAFLDCGATDNFYDLDCAQRRNLPFSILPTPRQLYLVNGALAAQITHTVSLRLKIDGHNEIIKFFLTNLGKYELILGRTWLKKI